MHLRPARRKARKAAIVEALCLLRDLNPVELAGGPMSEQGGVFWIGIPGATLGPVAARFLSLGYTMAADALVPLLTHASRGPRGEGAPRVTTWRGRSWSLVRIYADDAEALRERAADRRLFLLETGDGVVRPIKGYRGDGRPLGRRGLPVYDARLLVNLVFAPAKGTLLDPFAGVGGVVLEAVHSGWDVVSADIDPALRHGLARLGAAHCVADVRSLPLTTGSVEAIATEPPYDQQTREMLIPAFQELHRVLKEGGRLAVLCAAWQADTFRRLGVDLGLTPYLDSPIDRKGVAVVALAWQK